jgi:hypothetical protein
MAASSRGSLSSSFPGRSGKEEDGGELHHRTIENYVDRPGDGFNGVPWALILQRLKVCKIPFFLERSPYYRRKRKRNLGKGKQRRDKDEAPLVWCAHYKDSIIGLVGQIWGLDISGELQTNQAIKSNFDDDEDDGEDSDPDLESRGSNSFVHLRSSQRAAGTGSGASGDNLDISTETSISRLPGFNFDRRSPSPQPPSSSPPAPDAPAAAATSGVRMNFRDRSSSGGGKLEMTALQQGQGTISSNIKEPSERKSSEPPECNPRENQEAALQAGQRGSSLEQRLSQVTGSRDSLLSMRPQGPKGVQVIWAHEWVAAIMVQRHW